MRKRNRERIARAEGMAEGARDRAAEADLRANEADLRANQALAQARAAVTIARMRGRAPHGADSPRPSLNAVVVFGYRKPGEPPQIRTVSTYEYRERAEDGRSYLVGWDHDREAVRNFVVERIEVWRLARHVVYRPPEG